MVQRSLKSRTKLVSFAALSLLALIVSLFRAERADACSPPRHFCVSQFPWTALERAHETVATDGALVFHLNADFLVSSLGEAHFTLEVRDEMDAPVPGSTIVVEGAPLIVFRPADLLSEGATLTATLTLDEVGLGLAENCGVYDGDAHTFVVTDEAIASMSVPSVEVEESDRLALYTGLDSLVCCGGALPHLEVDSCGFSYVVHGDEGHCASARGQRSAVATLRFAEPGEPDPLLTSNILVRFGWVGQEPLSRVGLLRDLAYIPPIGFTEPTEVLYELVHLGTGEILASETVLIGDEVPQLGLQVVDPSDELARECTDSEGYVCQILDAGSSAARWDPDACEVYVTSEDPGGASGATGCSANPAGSAEGPTLAMLAAALWFRRRRARACAPPPLRFDYRPLPGRGRRPAPVHGGGVRLAGRDALHGEPHPGG